ncbi:peroxin-14, partial [Lecanoromycetidae sp. Uapishka_2]
MSDSNDRKPKAIPSWQRLENVGTPKSTEEQPTQLANEPAALEDRASLVRKAAKFLNDEDIRDAPRERKEFFLTLKGLTEDEIRDLLHEQIVPDAEVAEGFGKEQQATSQKISSPITASPEEPQLPAPSKDLPPIITYPEFLLHSQKPPPLITLQRLLNTFYFATGAAATLYGTSKYIVEPMVESLTSARHSLYDTALADLGKLNEKLESTVSKVPDVSHDTVDDSDAQSTSSDGARFFNRSAATQTSPSLSRSTSDLSSSSKSTPSATMAQQSRLATLHDRLSDLIPKSIEAENPVKGSLDELKKYLDDLAYADIGSSGKKSGELDEIGKVKAEIRSVKGVLLSARNFPSGVAAR